jgi:hypothetical protein
MRTWTAESEASPRAAWALLARPEAWAAWAPHMRGAWGLGAPEVRAGSIGAARVLGVIPMPAWITRKREGESWTWRVGPVELVHRVVALPGGGCMVAIDLRAPGPLEPLFAATYGPVIQVMLNRLARVAAR